MKRKIALLTFSAIAVLSLAILSTPAVSASHTPAHTAQEAACITDDCDSRELGDILTTVTNVILFIVGAASVIVIIVGGLRYVLSGGDQQGVQGAKNSILYAVVGLAVAFAGYAIVNFVLGSL